MADLNPYSAWNRFLALPNESRTKTIAMAFIVAAVCALLVNGATVILRPIQAANRAHEEQVRLQALISAIPGMNELIDEGRRRCAVVGRGQPRDRLGRQEREAGHARGRPAGSVQLAVADRR